MQLWDSWQLVSSNQQSLMGRERRRKKIDSSTMAVKVLYNHKSARSKSEASLPLEEGNYTKVWLLWKGAHSAILKSVHSNQWTSRQVDRKVPKWNIKMKNFQELSNNVKLYSKYESKAPKIERRVGNRNNTWKDYSQRFKNLMKISMHRKK